MKKKKRFECGICLELMSWEKEPKILPCCGFSFCFLCLNKLFLLQNPSITSSSSPSSPSSPLSSSSSSCSPSSSCSSSSLSAEKNEKKKKGVKCPVCRKVNECERIETLDTNYLIPETIDILLSSSSNLFSLFSHSLSNQSGDDGMECANYKTCGERTEMFCSICNMFICDSCDPSHTSTIFSQHHKRSPQQHTPNTPNTPNINILSRGDDESCGLLGLEKLKKKECSKHPPQLICGYCFGCCVLVCVCCILETHGKHKEKVNFLEESVLKKRDEVVKIGDKLEKRLIEIEKKRKEIEEEMKELEEKLEKKRIEKKEIELEKEDLRIRKDSIVRLSNTPTDISLFDEQLFLALLQIANDIVSEGGVGVGGVGVGGEAVGRGVRSPSKRKRGVIYCDSDRFHVVSSFTLKNKPRGMSVNSDGNLFICVEGGGLKIRDKEGNEIESTIQKTIDSLQLEPFDVSIGLDDQIVVLDYSRDSHRVVILNKEGELMKSFGSFGSRYGQFNQPHGVDVDEEGRIIVADTLNHRIQVFENDGSFIRSLEGSQFKFPRSVVVDGDGNIVICGYETDQIEVVDIEGNFIRSFETFGSDDSQLDDPISVDVDGEGRIVVCDFINGRVSVFEKDGTFLFSFGKDRMKCPRGVVIDSSGTIIVSDFNKKSIEFWGVGLFSSKLVVDGCLSVTSLQSKNMSEFSFN